MITVCVRETTKNVASGTQTAIMSYRPPIEVTYCGCRTNNRASGDKDRNPCRTGTLVVPSDTGSIPLHVGSSPLSFDANGG
jgi:hypothetical protein